MSTGTRFKQFLSNIALTDDQKLKGAERRVAVVWALNSHYYGNSHGTLNSFYVGSWAKRTRIRPPRDVDVLYNLPASVYSRFESRQGNKQSQILQEVKSVLARSYPTTNIRGDGPVVIVPFTAYNVELIPAFALPGGGHWVCMTNNGGHYKQADYSAEASTIASSNTASNGNTRDLIRMMKRWQGYCGVPIKSFHIEILAVSFLDNWSYKGKSTTYYDWMIRDFLAYLVARAGTYVYAPGTREIMNIGSDWKFRAQTAHGRADRACVYEAASNHELAGDQWQLIFGYDMPRVA